MDNVKRIATLKWAQKTLHFLLREDKIFGQLKDLDDVIKDIEAGGVLTPVARLNPLSSATAMEYLRQKGSLNRDVRDTYIELLEGAFTRPTPAAAAGVPTLQKAPQEGDWPEDFAHENGQYLCQCCHCRNVFTGHKRRVVCKTCARSPVAPAGAPPERPEPLTIEGRTEEQWCQEAARIGAYDYIEVVNGKRRIRLFTGTWTAEKVAAACKG